MAEVDSGSGRSGRKTKGHVRRRSFALRKVDARAWLERLVPVERITDERVIELAAYVDRYRPGSKYQVIADAMVKNGELPEYEKVAARYQSRREAWIRRNAPMSPVEFSDSVIAELIGMIKRSWRLDGRGPSWTEVRESMGWDRSQTWDALHRLRELELIGFTKDAGSLTAGKNYKGHGPTDNALRERQNSANGPERLLVTGS